MEDYFHITTPEVFKASCFCDCVVRVYVTCFITTD